MPSHDHCCAPQCANVRDPFDKTLKFPRISQLTQTFAVSVMQGSTETICVWETWHQILSEHFCEGCKTVEHPVPIYFAHKTYRYPVGRKRPRPRSDSPCDRPASEEGIVVAKRTHIRRLAVSRRGQRFPSGWGKGRPWQWWQLCAKSRSRQSSTFSKRRQRSDRQCCTGDSGPACSHRWPRWRWCWTCACEKLRRDHVW